MWLKQDIKVTTIIHVCVLGLCFKRMSLTRTQACGEIQYKQLRCRASFRVVSVNMKRFYFVL